MNTAIEKIIKILNLERKRNFDNKTVFGGLVKLSSTWKKESVLQGTDSMIVQAVDKLLNNYEDYDHFLREKEIAHLFTVLEVSTTESPILAQRPPNTKHTDPKRLLKKADLPVSQSIESVFEIETYLSNPVTFIPGIGKSRASALEKLNIHNIKDLIMYFPKKYEDFSNLLSIKELEVGKIASVKGIVRSIHSRMLSHTKRSITEIIIEDTTSKLKVVFFNNIYIERSIKPDNYYMFSGKVEVFREQPVLNNPEWIEIGSGKVSLNRLYPYYSLSRNITQKWLREVISKQLDLWVPRIQDFFSPSFREEANLLDLNSALFNIHFPENLFMKSRAEERFSFQDTFFLHLIMQQQKKAWQSANAKKFHFDTVFLNHLYESIPFQLTPAQHKVISEILVDLASGTPTSRLIQGDVGSGKTIVAAIIIAGLVRQKYQAAVLAPTGILAEQLYKNISAFLLDNGLLCDDEISFLSGKTSKLDRSAILKKLQTGEIKLIVGTHALLEDDVRFNNLQFVLIDEQHRFGVMQRKKIHEKGSGAHLLVMSATPIPRTLALTFYGDMDISIIDSIPPGRQKIITQIISPNNRNAAYQQIRENIHQGSQAFIVFPLVATADEEMGETNAAVNEFHRLKTETFPNNSIGLLHGRLKEAEKERVMQEFRDGIYQILVTTTVIEVGVDVPNATIMMVEGANRFGLSQLHQLRGRVGRGKKQSCCILVPESENVMDNERLKAMVRTTNGFELAEIDLEQRGPGDFIGIRQSGFKEIRISNIMNVNTIEKARLYAKRVLDQDPDLIQSNNQFFRIIMEEYQSKMAEVRT